MYKVTVIGSFYGAWPVWFPAFLLSCRRNPEIEWLFFTDCPIPAELPKNITFVPYSLDQLNRTASQRLDLCIQKSNYSQVDLRPAYGAIFAPYLKGIDFWGHCDFDVVWGDIRHFIPDSLLEHQHIISSRKKRLAGHFNLWKNVPEINQLFESAPGYQAAFKDPSYTRFDEKGMFDFISGLLLAGKNDWLHVHWPEVMVADWPELEKKSRGWYWEEGKLYNKAGCERIYMHFMTWKKSMKWIDFQSEEQPRRFTITRRGIWSQQAPWIERLIDATQLSAFQRTQPIHTKRPRRH